MPQRGEKEDVEKLYKRDDNDKVIEASIAWKASPHCVMRENEIARERERDLYSFKKFPLTYANLSRHFYLLLHFACEMHRLFGLIVKLCKQIGCLGL